MEAISVMDGSRWRELVTHYSATMEYERCDNGDCHLNNERIRQSVN